MSLTHELREDRRFLWDEQRAITCRDRFQTAIAGTGATGDILYFVCAHQGGGESTTVGANFFSTTEAIGGQGVLTFNNFNLPLPEPETDWPDLIAVPPLEWPLKTEQWSPPEPGALLNTLLWLNEFQHVDRAEEKEQRKGLVLSEDVLKFCSQHRIFGSLQLAAKLVHDCFPSVVDVCVEKECDPESDDEWLLLTAQLEEQIEIVLKQYDNYMRCFINLVPWPQRNKIRFIYDLI